MLSIVIPTYNEEKYIRGSLESLKKLTLPHEIVITDDKSTDKTVEIAQGYGVKVLVPEKKHRSIAENRNTGAKATIGEFLVFMDCDSRIMNPDAFFAHALNRFKNEPELVALAAPLQVLPEQATRTDNFVYVFFNGISQFKNNTLHIGEASGKFQIIRRSAFEKINGFREDLIAGEDGDIFYRLSKVGQTRYDPKLTIFHSGRRAHKIGWPKLLSIWMWERFHAAVFNRSSAKEWVDIR